MFSDSLISVIVPIYNVESYLDRCVDSILTQTYDNLEVILVDDGSPDTCASKVDYFALSDDRIISMHKPNGGLSESRNCGMEHARGTYIGFVDGDDCIADNMYEYLHNIVSQNNADIAECQMTSFTSIPNFENSSELSLKLFETNDKIISELINQGYFSTAVPRMLVKSEYAKSVQFDVGKFHEDILWPYRVCVKCKRAVTSVLRLYGYYQRSGSIMNTTYSCKRFDGLDALQTLAGEVKSQYPALYPIAEKTYAGSCMYQYQYLARQKKCEEYKRYMKILHYRFCTSDRKAFLPSTDVKYKIWYTMFAIMPRMTSWIRNTMKIGL